MIGLNGSYRDQEMSKTINSGYDFWNAYADKVMYGYGEANINGVDVEVERTHYYAGGSDTHDVLTPYASNLTSHALNERVRENREEFFTGKVRSYAAVETEAGEYAANALAYGEAMVNGNSYTTTGPILTLENVPGNDADGTVHAYPVNEEGAFETTIEIDSLTGIRDILVLTSEADGQYKGYTGKANQNPLGVRFYRQFALGHVDTKLSIANGIEAAETDPTICALTDTNEITNEYTYELSFAPETKGLHWVALCVVDIYGNFAVTNAYWVDNSNFPDVVADDWFYGPVNTLADMGIITGYEDGTFGPEGQVTRAEFAAMMYRSGAAGDAEGKANTFSDVPEGEWYTEAVNALAAAGIVNGYGNGTFNPSGLITRAEMAQMIYKALGEDKYFDHGFVDVQPSSWYYNAVTVLYGYGIINGMGDGTFQPAANATRAQAAQIIFNVVGF